MLRPFAGWTGYRPNFYDVRPRETLGPVVDPIQRIESHLSTISDIAAKLLTPPDPEVKKQRTLRTRDSAALFIHGNCGTPTNREDVVRELFIKGAG